jgi:hypothetical protein
MTYVHIMALDIQHFQKLHLQIDCYILMLDMMHARKSQIKNCGI